MLKKWEYIIGCDYYFKKIQVILTWQAELVWDLAIFIFVSFSWVYQFLLYVKATGFAHSFIMLHVIILVVYKALPIADI